jgi:hypothetical protein
MIRASAATTLALALALSMGAAHAQQASPAPNAPPAEVVVDPAAVINTTSPQANMLTGFYATLAVIDLCDIAVDTAVLEGMNADRARLENSVGLDSVAGERAYAVIKENVQTTKADCAEGSPDRQSVDAVTAIYSKAVKSAPAAAPAPAAAVPAADGAPAAVTPAQ